MSHSVLQVSPTSQAMVSPEASSAPAPTAAEKALNEGRAAFILSRAAERAALNNHRILFQRRRRFGLVALILAALTLAGLVGGGRIATGDSDAGRYSAPIAAYAPPDEVGSLPDAPVHNLWGFVP